MRMSVARIGVEEDICRLLAKEGLQPSALAEKLGISPGYAARLTNNHHGDNITLRTLAKIAVALGAMLEVRLTAADEVVRVVSFDEAREIDDREEHREDVREFTTHSPEAARILWGLDEPSAFDPGRVVE